MNVTKDVLHALQRDVFPPPRWCFATEVQVPYEGGKRFLDAVAVNLHTKPYESKGFEVKVSRSDFQHELSQPEKIAPGRGAVDRFYFVFGSPDLYRMEEVPEGVGVVEVVDGGCVVRREASRPKTRIEVGTYDRGFMAAFLSRVQEHAGESPGFVDRVKTEAEARGYRKGVNAARRQSPYTGTGKRKHSDHARPDVSGDVTMNEDGLFCD